MKYSVISAVACAAALTVLAQERPQDRWNLAEIYPTTQAFNDRPREGGTAAHEPGARERYIKLLSSGSSDYPYELVKAAGVDLASPAPYLAVAARMNRIMDQMEAILAKRGK